MDIRPLEIADEDPLEVRPVADAVMQEEFEPRSNIFPHVDGEVLNDEVVIIHSTGSVGEPEVFKPVYTKIWKESHRDPEAPRIVSSRDQADQKQLIQMQNL